MHRFHYFIISACMLFTSCNKDEVITEEVGGQPIIELDSETGIYTVKVDHELTIAPTYQNVEDALFAWTIDGTLVSSGPSLQRTWNECGDFYVKLRVDNAEGYAEEELKVEVKELTPPVISLALPSQGLKVVRNTDYTFTPDIQHSDVEGFKIEWVREGKIVSTENTYTFNEKELGVYTVTINASNIDGTTTKDVSVEVVETMPYVVKFPTRLTSKHPRTGTLLPTVLFSCVRCWSISTIPVLSGVWTVRSWKEKWNACSSSRRPHPENTPSPVLCRKTHRRKK